MANLKKDINEGNLLNEEQQKNFDQVMKDYEKEQKAKKRARDASESEMTRRMRNKTFLAVAGLVLMCLSIYFMVDSYIATETSLKPQVNQETKKDSNVAEKKAEETKDPNKVEPTGKISKKEFDRETDRLKNEFDPFGKDGIASTENEEDKAKNDNASHVSAPAPTPATTPEPTPEPAITAGDIEDTYKVNGIGTKNGETICYMEDPDNSIAVYKVGDMVADEFKIISISGGNVTLRNEAGDTAVLAK